MFRVLVDVLKVVGPLAVGFADPPLPGPGDERGADMTERRTAGGKARQPKEVLGAENIRLPHMFVLAVQVNGPGDMPDLVRDPGDPPVVEPRQPEHRFADVDRDHGQ